MRVLQLLILLGGALPACAAKPGTPKPIDAANDGPVELPRAEKRLQLQRLEPETPAKAAPLLDNMRVELTRSMQELGREPAPPYYMAYGAYETRTARVLASDGCVLSNSDDTERSLDVELRVGSPQLDNTHGDSQGEFLGLASLPLEDDPLAVRTPIWLATERSYRAATEALIQVRATTSVQADAEDQSPDFSAGTPVSMLEQPQHFDWNASSWLAKSKRWSQTFLSEPRIETSYVEVSAGSTTRYFVNSEGTTLQTSGLEAWVSFGAEITAEDGTRLRRDQQLFARTLEGLPNTGAIEHGIRDLMRELLALYAAPAGDPYVGPALLDGRAAAVLFHEVLGHRAEGHRQRADWEGKTFKKKVKKQVLPRGFNVVDDPLLRSLNGVELNGAYMFDDEGVAAQRVGVVEDGSFLQFLMSRTPIEGFPESNGHGRKQAGYRTVSRQGNLIVDPDVVTEPDALKRALLHEVRQQGLPFGIRVSEVTGGETQTGAFDPQAFQVEPVLVYRVYPNGQEELIRNVKLEGTPLSLLSNVVAGGNDYAVFNGFCGAESGQVPVSAVSPSLLVSKIEVARSPKGVERPPLLPPPTDEDTP